MSMAEILKEHYLPKSRIVVRDREIEYDPRVDPIEALKQAYVNGEISIEELEETLEWKLRKDDERDSGRIL